MINKLGSVLKTSGTAIAGYLSYPLITLIIGNGFLWNYTQSQLQHKQYNLEEAVKLNDLRKIQNDILLEIIQTSEKYLDTHESFQKTGNERLRGDAARIAVSLESLKVNYRELEKNLAQLENRPPQDVNLNFLPPAPVTNIRIE